MAFKVVILAAVLAVANAGLLGAPIGYGAPLGYAAPALASPAITTQQSNILRTPGNLGQVSTYSKTINTPYSSVSKSDVRVSNDALAYGAVAHAPALGLGLGLAAPGIGLAAPGLGLARTIAAPGIGLAAPGLGLARTIAAPGIGLAAPGLGLARTIAAPGIGLAAPGLGLAAPIAHVSFAGLGASYAW